MNQLEFNAAEAYTALSEMISKGNVGDLIYAKRGAKLVKKCKVGHSIKINPKNKGKFTRSAKAAGQSVQEHAKTVLANPKSTLKQRREAQFAENAKHFNHSKH